MTVEINAPKLGPLVERMQKYPDKLDAGMKEAMQATLLVMWSEIPPYPPKPEGSDYIRRGSGGLGGSLGSSEAGTKLGKPPDIFETKPIGGGVEGRFGSNIEYAPYVVGDGTQAKHMRHWWTLSQVAEKAKGKIDYIWNALARAMAKFIEGQGE